MSMYDIRFKQNIQITVYLFGTCSIATFPVATHSLAPTEKEREYQFLGIVGNYDFNITNSTTGITLPGFISELFYPPNPKQKHYYVKKRAVNIVVDKLPVLRYVY